METGSRSEASRRYHIKVSVGRARRRRFQARADTYAAGEKKVTLARQGWKQIVVVQARPFQNTQFRPSYRHAFTSKGLG